MTLLSKTTVILFVASGAIVSGCGSSASSEQPMAQKPVSENPVLKGGKHADNVETTTPEPAPPGVKTGVTK